MGVLIVPGLSVSAGEEHWVLPADRALCLVENREAYLEQRRDVIVIIVDQCPLSDLLAGSGTGLLNFGGVSNVQTGAAAPEDGFDRVISYTADELRCLDMEHVRIEDGVAYLPRRVQC
ncbi:hypothetical protein [Roseicyclus elongatus]|uniref:hypothetical protein n=1 Tax=Roseicyclus elongatus TaxID=159346 RepID=UPI0012EC21B7|nr:hypothetical protein [Roseibacterium elongatum]